MPRPAAYHLFETEFGICGIAWTAAGLTRVQLPERDVGATDARLQRYARIRATPDSSVHAAMSIALLQSYMRGELTDFSAIALDAAGIQPQEQAIYAELRRIGSGRTTTYGQLAHAIGAPGAARVVGRAMARNPWPVIVPCHRVLTAQQTTGGFSAYGGIDTKLRLLRLEHTRIGQAWLEQTDLFG